MLFKNASGCVKRFGKLWIGLIISTGDISGIDISGRDGCGMINCGIVNCGIVNCGWKETVCSRRLRFINNVVKKAIARKSTGSKPAKIVDDGYELCGSV